MVANAFKDNLKIKLSAEDVNIAYRIGNKTSQTSNRPIIVKLFRKAGKKEKKKDTKSVCITMKPNLYINGSLTLKRLGLFKLMRNIRKKQ